MEKNNEYRTTLRSGIKWQLMLYDAVLLVLVSIAIIVIYPSEALILPAFDTAIQDLIFYFVF